MAIKGAGQINGPCDGDCYWRVEAAYLDGSTTKNLITLNQATLRGRTWSHSAKATATDAQHRELTHVRAVLAPTYSTSGRETYTSEWIQVGSAYPRGGVDLTINSWQRDASTGLISYDLDVDGYGAGQLDGPCDDNCYWVIDALHTNGSVGTFRSGPLDGQTWVPHKNVARVDDSYSPGVTALRARLVRSYPTPTTETYESTWIGVTDFVLDEIDVAPLAGFLAASNVTDTELCLEVEEKARELRIPDATPGTTTHSLTDACISGSGVRAALKALAAMSGGAAVIGSLINHFIGDDPNADSIAKVAALPEAAGSGIRPPTSCLSDAQKASILSELVAGNWLQNHHAATNKGESWKQLFIDKLAEYEYAAGKSLGGDWNIIEGMPHRGTHPPAYHFWIYRNLESALRESTTWDEFHAKWSERVLNEIRNDPTIVRWEWWRC